MHIRLSLHKYTSKTMKRLFIALPIHPDPQLIQLVASLKSDLRYDSINWVNITHLHLTLKFVGATKEETIPTIKQAMQRATDGIRPFNMAFDKLGVFGSSYNPRVIWIGLHHPNAMLNQLADKVLNEMDAIGFKRDRQNFVSHLTLGRIREIVDKPFFQQTLQRQPQVVFQQTEVYKIVLIESILNREGPSYIALEVVNLT